MGFNAGCVLVAAPLERKRVVDGVAAFMARIACPPVRLLITPSLALDDVLVARGKAPSVGFVSMLAERGNPGNDVLAHLLGRTLDVPTVALACSDHMQSGAYELWLPPPRELEITPESLQAMRPAGGLSILGSARVGATTLSYLDVPRLGLAALLDRDVKPKEPHALLAALFDAALAAPDTVIVRIDERGSAVGPARRIRPDHPPDPDVCSWGFSLWPATPHVARRRRELLSGELP
ncbi:MAG TPA: hypothetical protein VH877_08915 [Polyangia bacterium]|jgi:hypothetical protein|nr:hypothetical protein [Polyangia bacterium]